jgi:hypothetical protein
MRVIILLILLLFSGNLSAFLESEQRTLSVMLGSTLHYLHVANNNSIDINGLDHHQSTLQPIIHIGLNNQFSLTKNLRLGYDSNWVYHPLLFNNNERVWIHPFLGQWSIPAWTLLACPVTDLTLNYVFSNRATVGVGLTYSWGAVGVIYIPLANNCFLEMKSRWFLDHILDDDKSYDIHLMSGIAYEF